MTVNLPLPQKAELKPVKGFEMGIAEAGIKKANRKDLLVMTLAPGSQVAGVFTLNRFCAAPVQVCREHLAQEGLNGDIRALVVNTGNANAGTGESGMKHALQTCADLAKELQINPEQILPFSTGVILEPLPIEKIISALPKAVANLGEDHWFDAAEAIMTTDTQPKATSATIETSMGKVTITGICKGAGMIHPNMATMLGFIATDAGFAPGLLASLTREIADLSFNAITIDGDTSTNDSFIIMATGQSAVQIKSVNDPAYAVLRDALIALARKLAQMIVRDGEGATKFMTIEVVGGKTSEECRLVAKAVAHSPLVKTAFFASDPNLGRILAAIGYAGITDLDVDRVQMWLGDVWVAKNGGRNPDYQEADGQRVMQAPEITVKIDLGRGSATQTMWTCDLSHDYVSINADYRSQKTAKSMNEKLDRLLDHLDTFLPKPLTEEQWKSSTAFRWRRRDSIFGSIGFLQPVKHVSDITFEDLQNIDRQRDAIRDNTKNFIEKKPANNILLTGARGTGKSSLIKASLHEFANQGLRLVEVEKEHLADLADITELLAERPERFIIFCDDLSFEDGESGYKAMKSALDGSVSAQVDNILIYATSNRRHLLPEYMKDNEGYMHSDDGEIHPGEVVEEKISLSERFGLWLSFYPPKQDEYLAIVAHWLQHFGLSDAQIESARSEALVWALERGSRSGRVAWQFAKHWAGSRP